MRYFFYLSVLFFSSSVFAQPAEVQWLNNINPTNPNNSNFWVTTSKSAYPVVIVGTSAVLINGLLKKDKKLMQAGYNIVGTLVVNTLATQALKTVANRERPFVQYPLLIHPYDASEKDNSLPSGHTSTAFAFATALSLEHKKWYIVAPSFLYASFVGYSRLYLGEHYPSDVFIGAAIGIGSAYANKWLQKKLFKKK
jgi:membrane-associated phospholipid phosphatase